MAVTISLGWQNSEGFSEEQIKTFKTEDDAYAFCIKHIDKIMRIGTFRVQRNEASYNGNVPNVIEITEEKIRDEIRNSCK